MSRLVLLVAVLGLLVMCSIAAAEPKHVDGGWQRSDEVPQETPTAPPSEVATESEEPEAVAGTAWLLYGVVGACGLLALTALLYGLRRDA